MSDDLCYLPGHEVMSRYREGTLSPLQLIDALIARIERENPKVNAFADTYFDEARAAAKASEARLRDAAKRRPLEGLPVAVKDVHRVKGKRTTQGSLIYMDHVDDRSDPMIERLQNAGAIILGRTTVPEFCLSGVCRSRAWGTTRNPWNLEYGPGGSSGGSGAALAAGMTTLATGTDIGGSIRIPASVCGVVGYKPPHGRNPDGPPANFDRFNHCGPLTRSVRDAALMQNVTSGPHPLDHDSLRDLVRLPESFEGIAGWRIAYSIDLGYVEVDPQVRRNTLAALDVLRALGATVEEVDLGWTADVERLGLHWWNTLHFGRITVWEKARHPELMTDYALRFAEMVERATGIDDVHKSLEMAHRMYQSLGPILDTHEVFICPTATLPAVKADHDPYDADFRINGVKVDAEYGWVMTHQFNMLSNCPVMSVPTGHASTGVPTGMQIVGRTFDDQRVFQAAAAYEAAAGPWYRNPQSRPAL